MPDKPPPANLPFMPLYVSDLFGSTPVAKMSNAAFGCYIKLLCHAWAGDNPPYLEDDDEILSRLCNCTSTEWSTVRYIVRSRFRSTECGKWLVNEKQLEVWKKQSAVHEQRVLASKAGVAARRLNRAVLPDGIPGGQPAEQPGGITNSELRYKNPLLSPVGAEGGAPDRDHFPMSLLPPSIQTQQMHEAANLWAAHLIGFGKPVTASMRKVWGLQWAKDGEERAISDIAYSIRIGARNLRNEAADLAERAAKDAKRAEQEASRHESPTPGAMVVDE